MATSANNILATLSEQTCRDYLGAALDTLALLYQENDREILLVGVMATLLKHPNKENIKRFVEFCMSPVSDNENESEVESSVRTPGQG